MAGNITITVITVTWAVLNIRTEWQEHRHGMAGITIPVTWAVSHIETCDDFWELCGAPETYESLVTDYRRLH